MDVARQVADDVLAGGEITEGDMHMAVDQPRRGGGAVRVDHHLASIERPLGHADAGDPARIANDRIGLGERLLKIAGGDLSDIPDPELHAGALTLRRLRSRPYRAARRRANRTTEGSARGAQTRPSHRCGKSVRP